jgi:hypothetical protein
MQKRGMTACGTQRWYCVPCKRSGIKKRPDNGRRRKEKLFNIWLTGNATLADLAFTYGVSIQTVHAWLDDSWQRSCTALSKGAVHILVLDATHLATACAMLIALDAQTNRPVSWYPAVRESYAAWKGLLIAMPQEPAYVVCDGHLGLIKSVRERWPNVLIQRCMAHVLREMRSFLTRNPKSDAGIALRVLVNGLMDIETRRQKRRWVRKFFRWQKKYATFLKQRTKSIDGRFRYTHRKLRRARTHLLRALPDLFRYVRDSRVPRTSNQLEGGVNSPLKDLIRKHRGMKPHHELVLMSLYLKKRARKPPRCFN